MPVVTIARDASSVTEGTAASFTLTATPVPVSALTVNLRVADVAAAGGDFVAAGNEGAREVDIPNSGTATFTVATVSDSTYEAGGDLTATVVAGDDPAAYTVGSPSSASVAVADNDTPGVFWEGNAVRPERPPSGDNSLYGFLALQVTRDLGSALTVRYTIGGTATCGEDYSIDGADCGTGSGAFTLPAGTEALDELVVFLIAVRDDTVADNGETIIVTMLDGAEYDLGSPAGATMTIYEETGQAAYSIVGTPQVGATLTVRQDRPDPDGDRAVTYEWRWKTESATSWRVMSGERGATFAVRADREGHFLSVGMTHEDGNGFVTTLETPSVGPVTVPDTPTVNLSVSNSGAASEGGGALTITATRSAANDSGATLSIPIRVKTDDTDAQATDYTLASSIDIANTASSGTTAFTVVDDGLDEPQERVVVELGALPAGTVPGPGSEVTITIADNDGGTPPVDPPPVDPPPGGGGGGGGSGGGGGTAAEVRIRDAAPAVEGSPLRFRIELESPAARRLDLLADTAPDTAEDGADYLGLRSHAVTVEEGESEAWLEVRTARDAAADEGEERLAVTLSAAPGSAPVRVPRPKAWGTILDGPPPEAAVPLLPAHAEARHGFVRVLDRGWRGGPASIAAVDDGGVAAAASTLGLAPGGAAHFRSSELEGGSAAKGLAPGTGAPTRGGWRLLLFGADVAAAAYARMADGFVTPLAGTLPAEADGSLFAAFFNPASNWRQRSLLRLRNPGPGPVRVAVSGTDDAGDSPGKPVSLMLAGGAARTLTAAELERGAPGLDGALGDGAGKWRLRVEADGPVEAMGLLESPAGHLANLSAATAPREEAADGTARTRAPLFPSASDPDGRQGFLRIVNRGAEPAEVRIEARDDAGRAYPALTLAVGAGAAVHLNSHDLEQGNAGKGLPLGTGPGGGSWRLALAGPSEVVALAYLRHRDGFVTGMNALAPLVGGTHRVDFLNPGSNYRQVGALRLMNPGAEDATARVTGVDDAGAPGGPVAVTVPAGRAVELTAAELEAGAAGADGPAAGTAVEGALGDGAGKWRLRVASDRPLRVMGLLESPTGHLANLSAGAWPPAGPDGAAPDGGR